MLGCQRVSTFDGPKVDSFKGRLLQGSAPASFPAEEKVVLQVIHEKGQSFGIPIKPDGSFELGWMPIGKYTAILKREKGGTGRGAPSMYTVPGGLVIKEGQTEYTIDLGKDWKR